MTVKEKNRCLKTITHIQKFHDEGYKIKEVTISPLTANMMGLVFSIVLYAPLFLLCLALNTYAFDNTKMFSGHGVFSNPILFIGFYAVFIIIHELIHGIFNYLFNGHDKSAIEFGYTSGMPYCTSQKPLLRGQYIVVLLMPTLIFGIIFTILAAIFNDYWTHALLWCILVGGGGDFTIIWKLLTNHSEGMFVVDHPIKCGYFELSKNIDCDEFDAVVKNLNDLGNYVETEEDKAKKKSDTKKMLIFLGIAMIIFSIVGFFIGVVVAMTEPSEPVEDIIVTKTDTEIPDEISEDAVLEVSIT